MPDKQVTNLNTAHHNFLDDRQDERDKEKQERDDEEEQDQEQPPSRAAQWAAQGYIPTDEYNAIVQPMGYPGVVP